MIIVLSPLGFSGTTIKFEEIAFPVSLDGCVSYVGHPDTKAVLEALGARTLGLGQRGCPAIGESYLAVLPFNSQQEPGWTVDQAILDIQWCKAILCTRVQ